MYIYFLNKCKFFNMSSYTSSKRKELAGGKVQLTLPFVKKTKDESNDQTSEGITSNLGPEGPEPKTLSKEENKTENVSLNERMV